MKKSFVSQSILECRRFLAAYPARKTATASRIVPTPCWNSASSKGRLEQRDVIFCSGVRRTPDGGPPNGAALPSYTVVNLSLSHTWKASSTSDIEGRVAILNLFDKVYLLRDGTDIGVGAPQHGTRRTLFVGMTTHF